MTVYTPDSKAFKSLASGSDLSAKVGYFVKVSAETYVIGTDNATDGVLADGGAASGDYCTVLRGRVFVRSEGTITTGALVSCNGNALCIAAVGGDTPIGRALRPCTTGEWVEIDFFGAMDEQT